MPGSRVADREVHQRLAREWFIWWFRAAAVCFVLVQTALEPGDDPRLSWLVAALFAASAAATGLVLARRPSPRRVRLVGVASMAVDTLVVASVLFNNLTDPAEPVYLVGVLAMLEATIRWRRLGGVVAGVVAGSAAGVWTSVVASRTVGSAAVDYATMRAGVIIGLGVFLGSLVRKLTEQHETLQSILDTSRDLIVSVGADGRVRSTNAACLQLLGYAPEELVGQRYADLVHPEDLHYESVPPDLAGDGPVLFERRIRCRDGSWRWLEMNVSASVPDVLHVSARDVTERREVRRRIEESEQRFRSLFDHHGDAVFAFDLEGRFTMVNPATERITGFAAHELVGATFAAVVELESLEPAREHFRRAVAGESQDYETVCIDRAGGRIELDVTNVPIVVDGEIVGVFGIAKDVTRRRQLERELGHQATHDALTGLPNRAALEATLAAAGEAGEQRTLLFIDLDRFKLVNDSFGHRCGDEVLIAAVGRLQGHVRAGDLLARWAGDEFCVLLDAGTAEETALVVADRLRAVLGEPFPVAGREVRLSASIGLASAGAGDGERLIQVADLAMYEAKRAGRDRVSVYSSQTPSARTQLDLEAELAAAIDAGDVVAHYQPIVETTTGAVRAVEALVRWPQPDGTVRMPGQFVPIAEESGLIRLLTRHVVRDACRQLGRWDSLVAGGGTVQAWVNVSVADLESATFAADVGSALTEAGTSPERLVLEVTETMLMRDVAQVDATITDLRRLGVALAIDDFGTGYSSLSRLHQLQVAACKIDREFVSQAPERAVDAVVLRALVDVGTALGVPVVAEGIERSEELAAVAATGCPLAQGFLLARPQAPEQLDEIIVAGRVALPGPTDLPRAGAVPSGR